MKVIKNYIYNALYQIFKVLIPFVTIPYLSRTLGPKGIGINSYTNSVIQYFILIGDLGITIYGNRKIAYVRHNRYKLTQTFYEIMIMQICTLSMAYLAFFIFLMFTNQYYWFYLAQSIMIIATALDISWFFMGVENFKVTVLRNFIVKLIMLLCIFIFVKSFSDLLLYIVLYGLSLLLGNATLFFNLHKYIDFPDFSNLHIWRHFLPSLALFIPNVAMQVYLVLNKTMLGIFDNVKSVGFYDQSDKVIKILLAIVTATGTVMLPHVANAFSNGNRKSTINYLYDSFSFITAIAVAMMFGLISISSTFVPLFFGNRFLIVIPLIIIESMIIVWIGWSNAIGVQYLLPTNQTSQYTISIIVGAIVNIVVNVPMIIIFGVIGSILATVLSEMAVTLYQLFAVRHQISFKKLFKDFLKYVTAGVIMLLVLLYSDKVMTISWLALVSKIIIGFIIYMFVIFVMKANVFKIIKKMISSKNY